MYLKRTTLLVFALFFFLPIHGQEKTDYERYAEAAGVNMPIFRGRQSLMYRTAYNGTYWWDLEGTMRGDICFEGKEYHDMNLNIDANLQQVLLQWPGSALYVELERDQVDWFTRGDRKFVNLRRDGYASAPAGFYEVLFDGQEQFLVRVDRLFTSGTNGRLSIGYDDPNFRDEVINHFIFSRNWYLIDKDGALVKVKTKSAFLKAHKDRKRELKKYFRSFEGDSIDYNTWGIMALEYLENNG